MVGLSGGSSPFAGQLASLVVLVNSAACRVGRAGSFVSVLGAGVARVLSLGSAEVVRLRDHVSGGRWRIVARDGVVFLHRLAFVCQGLWLAVRTTWGPGWRGAYASFARRLVLT